MALDPGETTGWALFDSANLMETGQLSVKSLGLLARLIRAKAPDHIVMENYRVYADKAKQHVGSTVPTIQYIGAIKLVCELDNIPLSLQWAFQAKQFVTDARLKDWGLYQGARPHANDAIRHACYWYVFGKSTTRKITG